MDGEEALRSGRERRLGPRWVHGQGPWVYVDQHGSGSGLEHGRDGRSARVADRDDFIAGAHAQGLQCEPQGVGAAGDPHPVGHAAVLGQFALELGTRLS
jgi:hypothetical protein